MRRQRWEPRGKLLKRPSINGVTLHHCDFRELKVRRGSVKVIFTDPPYQRQALPLWDDLGKFSKKVLAADGILIAYSGIEHLPTVMNSLGEHHDYQPNISEALHYIDVFAKRGSLVCDPFGGSFTTAVAAAQLGRKFVGCDIDERCVEIGYERLSEANSEWSSSEKLFRLLDREFHFTLDVAASEENAKCQRYFTIKDNGLRKRWGKHTCFCNCPYDKIELAKWVRKAFNESKKGATVVMLLPSRTHAEWFHKYCVASAELRFVKNWLPFKGRGKTTTQSCLIAIFRPGQKQGFLGPSIKA